MSGKPAPPGKEGRSSGSGAGGGSAGGGGKAGSGGGNYPPDRKLVFHVRQYAGEQADRGLGVTEDGAVAYLLNKYREYQRKPQAQLRRSVGRALKAHLEAAGSSAGGARAQRDDDMSDDEAAALAAEAALKAKAVRAGYKKAAGASSADGSAAAATNKPEGPLTASAQMFVTAELTVERPTARYSDLGGISGILQETLLANAIAGELGVAFVRISAPEIVSGMSGESEQKVRELFAAASAAAPCIVFMDEVDAITPKRETSSRGMEKRIVAQLLTCMDSLSLENTGGKPVIVIGATNRPNDLDSALRRAGRFDREICLGVPDQQGRQRILEVMCGRMRLSGEFDYGAIAKRTPGFVGADLSSLTKEAAVIAINRIFRQVLSCMLTIKVDKSGTDEVEVDAAPLSDVEGNMKEAPAPEAESNGLVEAEAPLIESTADTAPQPFGSRTRSGACITMDDFLEAVKKVQPSAKREGFATVPDVTWGDIGALAAVREELSLSLLEPIAHPERFARLGLSMPAGVLLYGPPGCGKTLLAKAIANESGANFISVKGPELLDKYVGESEKAVRQVFQRARASSPCIVFFDELDSLCPRRGSGGDGGGGVSERVVNQLLTEMDGLEERRHVFVVAATNRPELIDPAMLRPGRLDKLLFVPLPGAEDRVSILRALAKSATLSGDVDLAAVGSHPKAEGYSGADLSALLREAGVDVLRRLKAREAAEGVAVYDTPGAVCIGMANFEAAFERTARSVSDRDRRRYLTMQSRLRRARAHDTDDTAPEGAAADGVAEPVSKTRNGMGDEPGSKFGLGGAGGAHAGAEDA
ncbi:putative ribosome biogenesis ATPase RIX7 [Tribonema minus]|uniref:Putative ribosome biogenesis ATPase RIX7 n=1 Tax=Tribonema minus TaxID=303371 RepID=A0A835ZH15_9STRA|nr:putative ribosome biogenesis ATPase RIX7 [Tribonema minus]